jgi:hypothetical protein
VTGNALYVFHFNFWKEARFITEEARGIKDLDIFMGEIFREEKDRIEMRKIIENIKQG